VSLAPFAIACAALGAWILSRAWVADDAFITWRVIENLVAGHGLRWNTDERVQVFTHPLWALLQAPLFAATGSLPFASFALSALCLGLAGVLAWRAAGPDRAVFLLALALPLAASRAFADHVVSGLESPLVALCTAAFAAQALRARPGGADPPWLGLSLAASLLATARPDALLLVLPCLAVLGVRHGVRWRHVAVGFLPLVAWEIFSILYFGFPFPNTKYAKLDTGIAAAALAKQGLWYALDLVRRDGASAVILILGLGCSAACGRAALRARPGDDREGEERATVAALGLGVAAHVAFVVAVGGDFMSGRFFAPAVFLAALLVGRALQRRAALAAAVAAITLAASLGSLASRPSDSNATWHGIADERRIFEPITSLWRRPGFRDGAPERHPWFRDGASARALARATRARVVIVRGAVGMLGHAAGPEVIVIDEFALGDPLLARLPAARADRWRIGHFQRTLPEGYLRARQTGDTSGMQPDLARYWESLRLVVSGPLLAPERLLAIARLNTGADDGLRDAYLQSLEGPRQDW
jgi:arabinofuranosyltransferase